jgi:hypothetical protein
MSYNPVKNVDFNSLPNYAIANIPILTYALLGITTLTLGYITVKDKESETGNANTSGVADLVKAPALALAPTTATATTPLEKGGRKPKSKSKSNKKTKKHKKF